MEEEETVSGRISPRHNAFGKPRSAGLHQPNRQGLAEQIGGPGFIYTFTLVAGDSSPLHEATALPGGFLFVPASLILAVQNEDESGGMIAHAVALLASPSVTDEATRSSLVYAAADATIDLPSTSLKAGVLQMWRKFEPKADRSAAAARSTGGCD